MNVLMITQSYYPYIGGVEKHVRKVSKEFIKKGHNVVVVTSEGNEELPNLEKIEKIPVYRFPKTKNLIRVWLWLLLHNVLIKNANIIHCHDYYVFVYWYLPFRFLCPLKPVFITFHGWEGHYPPKKKEVLLRKLSELLTEQNICIGKFITKWYNIGSNYISHGGIDSAKLEPSITKRKKNKALYVGRLSDDNAFLEYIKALGILKVDYGIDFGLDVYGDGPLKKPATEYVLNHGLDVSFHSPSENPYERSDDSMIAFSPGYLSILEALVHKMIVCSIFNNELKKDYFFSLPISSDILVIASSGQELAYRLRSVLGNPEETKFITEKGFKLVKKMTWEKVAQTYLKMYCACCKETIRV